MNLKRVKITTEQALYFRCLRNGLVGGHPELVDCAGRLLGAQAQVETHAFNSLSLRTTDRPTDAEVKKTLHDAGSLIRTWGQRDTLHLYAKRDWPLFQSASRLWARSGRRGGMPPEQLLAEVDVFFREQARALTRSDLFGLIPESYVEELREHPGSGGSLEGARRFAATRLIWCLAHEGRVVFAKNIGRELSYLHRCQVWSDEWPDYDSEQASIEVARRYFSTFGPATVQDLAHYLGARVSDARTWFAALQPELVICEHPDRGEVYLLEKDLPDLQRDIGDWPLRLLPAYDTMLMSHKDKRWILPGRDLEKQVWKKAAVVAPVVLVRGRIGGVWSYKKTRSKVDLTAESFGLKLDCGELEAEHANLARHLGVEAGSLVKM